ncbi:hypothetical protein [Clostridium sp. MD294]|uniref:hypothetical protein n=1 Tax=Clostridium sp. MD294 TaxID=97138 RepID=UPI0002CA0824|nr:hypothetical protein [Clostridium sp. MD294]USF30490.1 hypothetical protein C820_001931 [Clostridium sp. MD294]
MIINDEKIENIMWKQIERISEVSQKSNGIKLAVLTFSVAYLLQKCRETKLFHHW